MPKTSESRKTTEKTRRAEEPRKDSSSDTPSAPVTHVEMIDGTKLTDLPTSLFCIASTDGRRTILTCNAHEEKPTSRIGALDTPQTDLPGTDEDDEELDEDEGDPNENDDEELDPPGAGARSRTARILPGVVRRRM